MEKQKIKISRLISRAAFVLALVPVAIAALLVFSHTDYSPWGAFLDPVVEFVMEYGWSWTYWLAIVFAILACAGVIAGFFLQSGWPPRSVWILGIFTVLLALADAFLFFMIYEAGSSLVFNSSIAGI
jgi:hypothetical protein